VFAYTGSGRAAFFKSPMIQDAVVRNLEVVGEATKQVPESLRERAPELSWREMAGMRDKLIHDYLGVDLNLVWDVVASELPATHERIVALIEESGMEGEPAEKAGEAEEGDSSSAA
jgi:uncharacterized protein with HEPN domain